MANRFAQPTLAKLGRCRQERDALLAQARASYDGHGDARRTLCLVAQAREHQRKVMWARRSLGMAATAPQLPRETGNENPP